MRSKDAQKQLARTSLISRLLPLVHHDVILSRKARTAGAHLVGSITSRCSGNELALEGRPDTRDRLIEPTHLLDLQRKAFPLGVADSGYLQRKQTNKLNLKNKQKSHG